MQTLFQDQPSRAHDPQPPSVGASSRYCTTSSFQQAVQNARFAMTFGIVAIVGAVLVVAAPGLLIGLSLVVLGYGKGQFFKVLGGVLMGISLLTVAGLGFPLIGAAAGLLWDWTLAGAVAWQSIGILQVLKREGKTDPDWDKTQTRAIAGLCTASLAVMIASVWALVLLLQAVRAVSAP